MVPSDQPSMVPSVHPSVVPSASPSVPLVNFALFFAQQSTDLDSGEGAASLAIDGITVGDFNDGLVTSTKSQANPWLDVYFAPDVIRRIVVYNVIDPCCSSRLNFFKVTIFLGVTEVWSYTDTSNPVNDITTIIVPNKLGNIVRVEHFNNAPLNLVEVEVFK